MADVSVNKDVAPEGKKPLKKKLQTAVIALAIIAIAVGSIIYGILYVMKNEGTVEIEDEHVASLTAVPADEQGVIDYLAAIYAKVTDPVSTKVSVKNSVNIPEESLKVASDDTGLLNDLKFARKNITDNIGKQYYTDFNGVFGSGFEGNIPTCGFKAEDVDYAVFTEGADEQALKKFGETAKKDKTPENYNYVYISFPVHTLEQFEAGVLNNTFGLEEVQNVIDTLKKNTADTLNILSEDIECTDFSISVRANRFNDEIDYAIYTRNYTVTLDVEFLGELASYGKQTISFEYDAMKRYEFGYAGVRFADNVLYIECGDEVEIPHTVSVEDDGNDEELTDIETYEIAWASSNEEVAPVKDGGLVSGKQASKEPVTITATVKYLGETYTQQCQVYVINTVENIVVSQKEATLNSGETLSLKYTVEPDDATITDALWFSDNEKVATVDENGVVTAVSAGTADIYVVSKDQHFKSTCVVTVK